MGVVAAFPQAAELAPGCSAPVDQASLKDAFARLASGLALIACWDEGAPKGLVATSLIGLSVSPARVLFSVRHEASAHGALLRAERYSATILSAEDQEVAEAFATSAASARRFSPETWRLDDPGAPRYIGGLARFDLRTERRIGADSHTIFIAEILDAASAPGAPLVFFDRAFAGLALR